MKFNGTTSKVQNSNAVFANVSKYSFMCFFRAYSDGELNNGRIFAADDLGTGYGIRTDTPTLVRIRREFSTSFGAWDVSYTLNDWYCFAFSHNASLTSEDPIVYMRRFGTDGGLKPVTVTQNTAPVGTATNPAGGYCIGNLNDGTVTFDGDICFVQFWDRLLTQAQFNIAMMRPGSLTDGLKLYLPLKEDFRCPGSPNKNGTATAMVKGGMPPGILPYVPRKHSIGRVPTITSKPYYYRNFVLDRHRRAA